MPCQLSDSAPVDIQMARESAELLGAVGICFAMIAKDDHRADRRRMRPAGVLERPEACRKVGVMVRSQPSSVLPPATAAGSANVPFASSMNRRSRTFSERVPSCRLSR